MEEALKYAVICQLSRNVCCILASFANEPYDTDMEQIDLRAVAAAKKPGMEKKIPGFVYRYLNRILHVEEANRILADYRDAMGIDFTAELMKEFDLTLEVEGMDNLKQEGRSIFISNHPLGGLDGIALLNLIGQTHGSVRSLSNDFLMSIDNLKELFVPVNMLGSSREYYLKTERMFASEHPYLIFPAGLCSRKSSYGIYDLQWNKSFVKKARQHDRPVVPMCVTGRNSHFFYNLARLRKLLRIRFNIEMLYLVDEMFKQRHNTMKVLISPPIAPKTFDRSFSDWEWAAKLRQHVYTMLSAEKVIEFDPSIEVTLPNHT